MISSRRAAASPAAPSGVLDARLSEERLLLETGEDHPQALADPLLPAQLRHLARAQLAPDVPSELIEERGDAVVAAPEQLVEATARDPCRLDDLGDSRRCVAPVVERHGRRAKDARAVQICELEPRADPRLNFRVPAERCRPANLARLLLPSSPNISERQCHLSTGRGRTSRPPISQGKKHIGMAIAEIVRSVFLSPNPAMPQPATANAREIWCFPPRPPTAERAGIAATTCRRSRRIDRGGVSGSGPAERGRDLLVDERSACSRPRNGAITV